MKIEFWVPSVFGLGHVLAGAAICCLAMGFAGYPVEEWSGVVLVWALAFSATRIGIALFYGWAFRGIEEKFKQVLTRDGIDDLENYFPSLLKVPSVAAGFVFASLTVLATATGASLIIVDLVHSPLGFTEIHSSLRQIGLPMLMAGVAGGVIHVLMIWLWTLATDSLSDEALSEIITKIIQRLSPQPSSKITGGRFNLKGTIAAIVTGGIGESAAFTMISK